MKLTLIDAGAFCPLLSRILAETSGLLCGTIFRITAAMQPCVASDIAIDSIMHLCRFAQADPPAVLDAFDRQNTR